MRRKDRALDEKQALAIVDTCRYATMAMVSPRSTPYCVPVSIVREGKTIYFHCAAAGKKRDYLYENPSVCLTCVGYAENMTNAFSVAYQSAIVFGKAYPLEEEAEKVRVLRLLCEKHTPAHMAHFEKSVAASLGVTDVWRIEIRNVTGKQANM